jgi:xanthosine utilization system XapX-like protein
MSPDQVNSLLVVVSPIALALIGLINIWLNSKVHKLVNSAMAQEKAENTLLKSLLVAKQLEIDSAEKARLALATEVSRVTESVANIKASTVEVIAS